MVAVYKLNSEVSDPRFEGWMFKEGTRATLDPERPAYTDFDVENGMYTSWQCRSLKEKWHSQEVHGKVAPFNDYPCIDLTIPAFSQRAVGALFPMLEPNGEILPLDAPTGEYFAYNCTTKVDVLNLKKSVYRRRQPEKRFDGVERFEFYKSRLKGLSIFRVPECPTHYMVTDPFKNRVEQAGLNGFVFVKLWPLPEGVSWHDDDTRQHKKKLRALAGHTLVLRLRLQGRRPTSTEKQLLAHIEESLTEELKVASVKQPYRGTIEEAEFDEGEYRIFCSCPNVDTLVACLQSWLSEVFWEDDFAIDKRYGHLYDQKAKEKRVVIKSVRGSDD